MQEQGKRLKFICKKFGSYVLLGGIVLLLLFLNLFYQDHWLDSDMAAEMIFSGILSDEKRLIATQNWYYSTEFRVLYTQLVMVPLFKLFSDWHIIRLLTNVIFYALMLVSYFYFMKPLKVSRALTVLSACILLLPFSETMMTHMQMGNTYMSHVILIYLFFGMFLRLCGDGKKGIGRIALTLLYMLLSLICGISGVRYLLAAQCPLVLTACFFVMRSGEFQLFRVKMSRENLKALVGAREVLFLGYSLLGAVCAVVGYGINAVLLSRKYVFQTYGATNFIALYEGILFERIQNAVGCLLMLFGYIPDKGFLSLRGLVSMMAFVILGVFCFAAVKNLKRGQQEGKRLFLSLFLVISFCLNLFVFVFTTSTMVPRYYLTILIFALPVLCFYLEGEKKEFDRIALIILLSAGLLLGTGKTVLSFISVDKNETKRPVAEFLQENGYNFGFATYNNANIITELTNGAVEIGNIWDPEQLNYFLWSSPVKYYEKGYHEGEVFLLLTEEECRAFSDAPAIVSGEKIYEDGSYTVYLFGSREELLQLYDK